MNIITIAERISEELNKLQSRNPAFNLNDIENSLNWREDVVDPDRKIKVLVGNLSNYLIFVENKKDGYYLSIVCETDPIMATNDWLFGKGYQVSDCSYYFDDAVIDKASDYSLDFAKPVYEVKL